MPCEIALCERLHQPTLNEAASQRPAMLPFDRLARQMSSSVHLACAEKHRVIPYILEAIARIFCPARFELAGMPARQLS
jgi:hypothetical protein